MPHEPKKRKSKAAKRTRQSAIILKSVNLIACKNCNEKTLAHMACRSCGFYLGKKVLSKTEVKVTKA